LRFLVTVWHSPWPQLSIGFQGNSLAFGAGARWRHRRQNWVAKNGIDPAKIVEIGPVPTCDYVFHLEDGCALAPSRAEACTNL